MDRTLDVDQMESMYEYLVVLVQVTGTTPPVSLEQALLAIANKFGILVDKHLEIHAAAPPFDFLLIASDHVSYLTMLNGDRTIQTSAFSLNIRPRQRLIYADHGALYHRVQSEIEGILPHG